ncbi:hypothetical protein [Ferruginibacter sp.]|uniref:hypothetical protein n=1 Tax=Ferruginibacter sp. TaxID=1940288 RepID=UPI00265B7043|nr:hypothetical protein [Ferruginibacter sp.]
MLDEPAGRPVSSFKILVLAAIVAFVVGAIPALGAAIIYGDQIDQRAHERAVDTCVNTNAGRKAANLRFKSSKIDLQADITLYETVLKLTPKVIPAGNAGAAQQQAKLTTYRNTLETNLKIKKDKVLPLTKPYKYLDCSKVS